MVVIHVNWDADFGLTEYKIKERAATYDKLPCHFRVKSDKVTHRYLIAFDPKANRRFLIKGLIGKSEMIVRL